MIITIDAGTLGYAFRTGIGRYLECVLPRLIKLGQGRARFILLSGKPLVNDTALGLLAAGAVEARCVDVPSLYAWQQSGMAWQAWRLGSDVHFAPDGLVSPLMPAPCVGMLHDILWKRHPETLSFHVWAVFAARQRASLRKLSQALTGSEFSRGEFVREYGKLAEKIQICECYGVDLREFRPLEDSDKEALDEFRRKFGIAGDYYFCAGNFMPHKNLRLVLEAGLEAWRQGLDLPLMALAGFGGQAELISGLPPEFVRDKLRCLGYLSDAELKLAYRAALAFVFPSRYEGFGLPVLEAMACGVPVAHSDAGALREVAGQAGIEFSMDNRAGLIEVLRQLHLDSGLRALLRQKGLARAKTFSWDAAANNLWRAMTRAAGR